MKEICSQTYNSILGDSNEAVKHFSWNCYRKCLLYLTCLHAWLKIQTSQIISMILKEQLSHMCLVQRGMSVLMYGNGTNKQVRVTNYIKLKEINYLSQFIFIYTQYIQDIQLSSTSSNKSVS